MKEIFLTMSKICCLILNYNDAETTMKLVDLIKDYAIFSNILVVDNCSTDDSLEQLSKITGIEKIRVIQTNHNGGYGAGNNFGIRYAHNELNADYVLLSNPDVVFSEDLVNKLADVLEKNSKAAASTAIQYDKEHKPIPSVAWKIPSALEYAVSSTILKNFFHSNYKVEDVNKNEINFVECIPGAMLLYDVKKFLEVGGYDENMFLYCEEVTIAIKFKEKGYKTILLGKERYFHEHSVSIDKSIKSKTKQMEMIFNNRIYVMQNYMKSSFVTVTLARILHKRKIYQLNKVM